MPVIIVILVIALAVGPVMLMQPTPQQKRLAKLRGMAAAKGLIVGMASWPDSQAAKAKYYMRYAAPWQSNNREKLNCLLVYRDYSHELHIANNWEVHPKGASVPDAIKEALAEGLLPSIKAIGCGPQGVYVDWNEQRSVELSSVEELIVVLRSKMSYQ